jgi:hypothetical protein
VGEAAGSVATAAGSADRKTAPGRGGGSNVTVRGAGALAGAGAEGRAERAIESSTRPEGASLDKAWSRGRSTAGDCHELRLPSKRVSMVPSTPVAIGWMVATAIQSRRTGPSSATGAGRAAATASDPVSGSGPASGWSRCRRENHMAQAR